MPYWCGGRDSNPQNSDFKSDMYTNSITTAVTLLYLKQSCKSIVGTQSEIRTHRISPFERDDFSNLSIWALVGTPRVELEPYQL